MQQTNEEIIYRIISGEQTITLNNITYKVKTPGNKLRLEAENIYRETIRKNRFDNYWLSDSGCLRLLVTNGFCSADVDSNIKNMEKIIEDLKVGLFTSLFIPDIHKDKRKQLDLTKQKYSELLNIRHSLDHLTLKGYASMIKSQYLIFNTLYDENYNRIWNFIEDINVFLLERVSGKILENTISVTKLRELSRTEPWRGYWNIKKTDIFDGSVFDLTDEQRSLILYSKMYDSAYEHPECPTDEVIKDDDLFDGWMISQHRKAEKDKMTSQLDKHLGKSGSKMANADEMFLVAKSEEDRKRIESMNDTAGSIIKAQRRATIKKRGKAVDSQFQDRRITMQQQANQQFINKVKGNK